MYGRVRIQMAQRMMNGLLTHKHIIAVTFGVAGCYLLR